MDKRERSETQLMRKAYLIAAKNIEASAEQLDQELPNYTRIERESVRAHMRDIAQNLRDLRKVVACN